MKVISTGDALEDIRRLVHAHNFAETILVASVIGAATTLVAGAGATLFGGFAMDRTVFRQLLPDATWWAYAAGMVNAGDTNPVTLALVYHKDNDTTVTLGSGTHATATMTKKAIGPVDVFGTAGVPVGEAIPIIRLSANKPLGTNATLKAWSVWLRLLPPMQ